MVFGGNAHNNNKAAARNFLFYSPLSFFSLLTTTIDSAVFRAQLSQLILLVDIIKVGRGRRTIHRCRIA